jgi:hypothetical protein
VAGRTCWPASGYAVPIVGGPDRSYGYDAHQEERRAKSGHDLYRPLAGSNRLHCAVPGTLGRHDPEDVRGFGVTTSPPPVPSVPIVVADLLQTDGFGYGC